MFHGILILNPKIWEALCGFGRFFFKVSYVTTVLLKMVKQET